jgi:CP family cyanate transporter-like MFS transporter
MSQNQSLEKQDFIIKALPLFFVAMTLRPLTTSVGPVLPEIREDFGLSATAGSLLSTLPILMFGLGALLVPRLLHRISPNKAITLSLIALAVGGHLRSLITRRDFPTRIGGVMGMIAGAISFSAAVAALITYPIADRLGSWREALEVWAILPLIVLIIWHFYKHPGSQDVRLDTPHNMKALVRNPLAWSLTLYFGFQSINFHSMNTWLPTILREAGTDPVTAGNQLALLVLIGLPTGLFVPPLAAKFTSQVGLCVGFVAVFAVGLIGIYSFAIHGLWPAATWLWVFLLGVGLGSSFPLALTLVLLRSGTSETARDLGSFMQGGGYVISALGPLTLGFLRDITNSWSAAFFALGVALVVQLISGVIISRPVLITEEK